MMNESFPANGAALRVPIPMLIVDRKGKIIGGNENVKQVVPYDEQLKDADFYALIGVKTETLLAQDSKTEPLLVNRNDRIFRLLVSTIKDDPDAPICVYFIDVTSYAALKKKYKGEKTCVARIVIDNYDEMKSNIEQEHLLSIRAQADKIIRKWAQMIEGALIRISSSEYVVYFENRHTDEILRTKFSVLDEVRDIEPDADFPTSLSMGVAIDGDSIRETSALADAAIDLALGRGGDQAVVQLGGKLEYFGGKLQRVEKGTKGKSRVVAHALKRLFEQADRVMVMGHRNPDMDAFGSALGMYRVCQMNGVNCAIVLDEVNESLQVIYRNALEQGDYIILKKKRALELVDDKTLLIVLDTHRPSYVECPELLTKTDKIAVIDHHRRAADAIPNPALSYIEPYASSTAELVTELLQYSGPRKQLKKIEAEGLLAGMTVDTNRFAVKTGVRTFEAAAWLRRAGADTTVVKRLFQSSLSTFRARAKAIASAEITDDGIATSLL